MDTQDTKQKEKKENVLKKNSAMQEWKSCNRESVYIKLGRGGRDAKSDLRLFMKISDKKMSKKGSF